MIYTSNYKLLDNRGYREKAISISGDRGKSAGYCGQCYPLLAPKLSFWKIWKSNIGKVPEEENNKYYIREFYDNVLKDLDADELYNALDEKILLCYEDENSFCHRQVVASYLELFIGENVPEVKVENNNLIEVTNRNWIKEYLEEYIKSQIDMKGFESIRALRYYNKGEKLESLAKNNNDVELSKMLKSIAFDIDEEEKKSKRKKTK